MRMKILRPTNLLLAFLAVLPAAAHVLELPNKLALDGLLWLAVQQRLYRGWGPFFGAPVEIGALLTTVALGALRRHDGAAQRPTLFAGAAYVGMLAAFFAFNQPVNAALAHWTPASLPNDWPSYRQRWETGHVLAAVFALIGLAGLVRGWLIEHDRSVAGSRHR